MKSYGWVVALLVLGCQKGAGSEDAKVVTVPTASASSSVATSTMPSGAETLELAVRRGQISPWTFPPAHDAPPRARVRSCSVVVVFRQGSALVGGKAGADVGENVACDFGALEQKARASAAPLKAGTDKTILDVTAGISFPAPSPSAKPDGYTMEVKTSTRSFTAHDLGFPGRESYYAEPPGAKEGTYRRPSNGAPSRSVDEATFRLCDAFESI